MSAYLTGLPPALQALFAGLVTWAATAVGAASALVIRLISHRTAAAIYGVVAGVMLGAAVWSLLLPSVELAERQGQIPWVPLVLGLAVGGGVLRLLDRVMPHLHRHRQLREGPRAAWRRSTLLVTAITMHNIPEALALGMIFGAAAVGTSEAGPTFGAAIALTIAIALHNVPEGAAVSIPLRSDGLSPRRAFHYGHLSGAVEPAAAVLGAVLAVALEPLLPYVLSFAAGAMLFVTVEELIPESQAHVEHHDLATGATLVGFLVITILDLALA